MVIHMAGDTYDEGKMHDIIPTNTNTSVPDEKIIKEISDLFKILSDPTRLKILWTMKEGEVCACCISKLLGMSASAVSHQLKTLRLAHLVRSRRDGRNIYYSLDDRHVRILLDITLEHMRECK
jgi:ArsR family transcriptional regulator